ncbi:MAG: hypothetical protein QOK11_1174 [Pseudonocardiales bacterium]|nr:hypothetical protein [Pseudonocardiales bacterium]
MYSTAPAIATIESGADRRAATRLLAEQAAHEMYDAEGALHMARQAGVGEWVTTAYAQLHAAILKHEHALDVLGDGS